MKEYKAIVFDLDGTLLYSLKDLSNSMNRVLANNNYPTHTITEYLQFVGSGTKELARRVLPQSQQSEANICRFKELFCEDYANNWNIDSILYEGVEDLLQLIREKKLKSAIFSNKPQRFCELIAEYYFKTHKFDVVRGNVTGIKPKPDPKGGLLLCKDLQVKPDEVLYVGDSDVDMITAKNCGFFGLGAEWGYRGKEELVNAGSKITFKSTTDLYNFIKQI